MANLKDTMQCNSKAPKYMQCFVVITFCLVISSELIYVLNHNISDFANLRWKIMLLCKGHKA